MKTRYLVVLAMCVCIVLLAVAVKGQGQAPAQLGKKASPPLWEYQIVSGESVSTFNELGAEGWELCATTSGSPTRTPSFIFKRPKLSDPQAAAGSPGSKIVGTWELSHDDPPRRQLKIVNATHFVWVTYTRADGKPLLVGGGTYTIDDEHYKEKCEFGGPDLPAELVGKEQTFTYEVEDGKWTHSGTLSNGFEVHEVWRKVK